MMVDPYGRVLSRLGIFEEGFLIEDLPVVSSRTFYSMYGDVFPWGATVVGGLMLVSGLSGPTGGRARPRERRS